MAADARLGLYCCAHRTFLVAFRCKSGTKFGLHVGVIGFEPVAPAACSPRDFLARARSLSDGQIFLFFEPVGNTGFEPVAFPM